MFFTTINNTRRFAIIGDVLAGVHGIYDQCRAYTLYAPVGVDANGNECFVGAPRTFFDDEIEELF